MDATILSIFEYPTTKYPICTQIEMRQFVKQLFLNKASLASLSTISQLDEAQLSSWLQEIGKTRTGYRLMERINHVVDAVLDVDVTVETEKEILKELEDAEVAMDRDFEAVTDIDSIVRFNEMCNKSRKRKITGISKGNRRKVPKSAIGVKNDKVVISDDSGVNKQRVDSFNTYGDHHTLLEPFEDNKSSMFAGKSGCSQSDYPLITITESESSWSITEAINSRDSCSLNAAANKQIETKEIDSLQAVKNQTTSRKIDTELIDYLQDNINQLDFPQISNNKIDSLQIETKQIDSLQIDTKQIDNLQLVTKQIDNPHNSTKHLDSPQIVTKQTDSPQINTKQIESPQINTKQRDGPKNVTEQLDSPQIVTKQINSPQIITKHIDSPQISTKQRDSPQINNKQIESPQINTKHDIKQLDSPQIVTKQINSPQIVTKQINSPLIITKHIDSPQIIKQIDSPQIITKHINSPHITKQIDSPQIIIKQIDNPESIKKHIDSSQIETKQIDSPQIITKHIDSPRITTKQINSSHTDTKQLDGLLIVAKPINNQHNEKPVITNLSIENNSNLKSQSHNIKYNITQENKSNNELIKKEISEITIATPPNMHNSLNYHAISDAKSNDNKIDMSNNISGKVVPSEKKSAAQLAKQEFMNPTKIPLSTKESTNNIRGFRKQENINDSDTHSTAQAGEASHTEPSKHTDADDKEHSSPVINRIKLKPVQIEKSNIDDANNTNTSPSVIALSNLKHVQIIQNGGSHQPDSVEKDSDDDLSSTQKLIRRFNSCKKSDANAPATPKREPPGRNAPAESSNKKTTFEILPNKYLIEAPRTTKPSKAAQISSQSTTTFPPITRSASSTIHRTIYPSASSRSTQPSISSPIIHENTGICSLGESAINGVQHDDDTLVYKSRTAEIIAKFNRMQQNGYVKNVPLRDVKGKPRRTQSSVV